VVYRVGNNFSVTTNVTINATSSDNVYLDELDTWYYVYGENLSFIKYEDGVATYELRFDPDVANQTIYIRVGNIHYSPESLYPMNGLSFSGFMKLEIVDLDEPFHIGAQNTFTLNIEDAPEA